MKLMMILGGFIGFLIGIVLGLAQSCEWPSIIWRACVAAYACGLLMRWWGNQWVRSLHAAQAQNLAAAEAPNAVAATAKK